MLHTVAGWRQSRWHPQITLLLKIKVIVSDRVNRGNCLWCQHDRWKNIICWFHLWVESFVRSAEAPCTHLQGKQFSCRVLVCTSSSIYTQRSAVWQCTTFMLESVSREDWLNLFYFPRPSFCPFCLLHLFSCFVSPAQLWLTRAKGWQCISVPICVHCEAHHTQFSTL